MKKEQINGYIFSACEQNQNHQLENILSDTPVDINFTNENQQTPLHVACEKESPALVKILLSVKGIKVNESNKLGSSPLIVACQHDDVDSVKLLLQHPDIDIYHENDNKQTPLTIAAHKIHDKLLDQFLGYKNIDVCQTIYTVVTHFPILNLNFDDQTQHARIASHIHRKLNHIQSLDKLTELLDGIGIGNDNKKGNHDELSKLRFRKLYTKNHFMKVGYRNTNDSTEIATGAFQRAQLMLMLKAHFVENLEEYEAYRKFFSRKIDRKKSKKNVWLDWFEANVKVKSEAKPQP